MQIGRTERAEKRFQRRAQAVRAEPERAGQLPHRGDTAALDARRLDMGAADIPTDEASSVHATFLLNFFDELRRQIPAK